MFIPKKLQKLLLAILPLALVTEAKSVCDHHDINSLISRSDGICVGEVVSIRSFRRDVDSAIVSEYIISVKDAIRGKFPNQISLIQQGGEVDGLATWPHHLSADLIRGQSYVLFLLKREDGSLEILDGPEGAHPEGECDHGFLNKLKSSQQQGDGKPEADLTAYASDDLIIEQAVTASGLSTTPHRFQAQDRGEMIHVIVDNSTLPTGITPAQSITAVENALAAWEAETSVRFYLEGTETFASSAETISNDDYRIRLQLHDNFNSISDASSTLGFGGAVFSSNSGTGGTMNGETFRRSSNGYVVLNHPKASLTNAVTLEEVLCHEIGHVLGLAHSSETSPEADTAKAEAIMYYQAHKDGRGATINSWDITAGRLGYPVDNLPPIGCIRRMVAITKPSGSITNLQVNQIEAYDLDEDSITLNIASQTGGGNGTFSVSGSTITFTPGGWFGDAQAGDPVGSFYSRAFVEVSDGQYTGLIEARIIGFASDTTPSPNRDGLPDSWMIANFGSATPVPGTSGADDNPDGDNLTNLEEYENGTDPNDANSSLNAIDFTYGPDGSSLTWSAKRFELYKIEHSPNLIDWSTARYALVVEDVTEMTTQAIDSAGTEGFYRVSRAE